MSIAAARWAWSMDLSPIVKLVLLALADHADDAGRCWPSLSRLQNITGLSKSSVARALTELESERFLKRDRSPGGRSTRYTLQFDPIQKDFSTVPEGDSTGGGQYQPGTPTVPTWHSNCPNVGHEPSLTINNHQTKARAKFSPPSPEEVKNYCAEHDLRNLDPDAFCDFYSSKGWRVGNAPMKDWKAAARNWDRRSNQNQLAQPTRKQSRPAADVLKEQQL